MRYAIIRADGTHEVAESEGRLDFHKIQELVAAPDEKSANFEVIGSQEVSIWLNENGKYLDLETNEIITRYARVHRMIWLNDAVKGDCVITGGPDDEGYSQDVPDDVLAAVLSYA